MKFKYLKLTLLMAALSIAPFAMKAEAPGQTEVETAVLKLEAYLDPKGPQRTMPDTIAMIDSTLVVLEGKAEYADVYMALHEFKDMLIKLNIAQAKGVFERVATQLEAMKSSLSEGVKQRVNARLEEIKKLSLLQKANFMKKLGINFGWGKK